VTPNALREVPLFTRSQIFYCAAVRRSLSVFPSFANGNGEPTLGVILLASTIDALRSNASVNRGTHFLSGDVVMIASAVRMPPVASLSLPRIGAWSASLTIHLAIIALLLSAPVAIQLMRQVKANQETVVHIVEPPKPVVVMPAPLTPIAHRAPSPTVHRAEPTLPVQSDIHTPMSKAPVEVAPPSIDHAAETQAPDVAPTAIAYGSRTSVPYPIDAMRRHEQGTVILHVLVDADGKVLTVEIETSSGSPRLDRAARDAVRQWRFNPAKHGGAALSAWARVPVSFNLSTL
jgi:protein TonB